MSLERLWAPWRLQYVAQIDQPADEDCFICAAVACRDADQRRQRLVVWEAEHTCLILNRFPYNNGHLLIAPRAHKGELDELTDEEILESQQAVRYFVGLIRSRMRAEGFNVGLNLGRVAGAGLPGHLHWHVVPRWNGDVNFMPVLGETKVIVQSLEALFDLLTEAMQEEPWPG